MGTKLKTLEDQAGLRAGRSNIDNIFALETTLEKKGTNKYRRHVCNNRTRKSVQTFTLWLIFFSDHFQALQFLSKTNPFIMVMTATVIETLLEKQYLFISLIHSIPLLYRQIHYHYQDKKDGRR